MSEKEQSAGKRNPSKIAATMTNVIQRLKTLSSSNKKIVIVIVEICLAIAIFIALVFLVLFGIASCRFKSCHANATCIEQPFNAKCKCNYGFNGNGYDCDECGLSYPLNEFDTYGYDIQLLGNGLGFPTFSYPATVVLLFDYRTNIVIGNRSYLLEKNIHCLGALINRRSILTAASCFPTEIHFSPNGFYNDTIHIPVALNDYYSTFQSIFNVYLGINQYVQPFSDVTPTQSAPIEKIIIHSDYNDSSLDNDIAIVKLKTPVNLTEYIQLACIPDEFDVAYQSQYLKYGTKGFALGYSLRRNLNFMIRYFLTEFPLIIYNVTTCASQLPINHTEQLICAGPLTYNPQVNGELCQGYVGSPIYINRTVNDRMKNFVVAILINDTSCGIGGYANLFSYVDWINENSNY